MPDSQKPAFSFAALLGFGAKPKAEAPADDEMKAWQAKAEQDERYQRKAEESDDDYKKRCQALDAEHEEPDGDEKAKAAAADHAEALQVIAKTAEANANRRAATIIAHGIKLNNVEAAGVFAFDTDMSAEAAVAALDAVGEKPSKPTPRESLAERMAAAQAKIPKVEGDAAGPVADSPQAWAASVIAAGKKARGEV